MGDKTAISWTNATWNPIRGCSRVSEGCRNCYAERVAARFSGKGQPYDGLATTPKLHMKPARWTGEVRFVAEHLADPLRWRKPRRIFVNSMSDLFHDTLSNEQIAAIFGVMAACPQHTFQVLTKRARRMRAWFAWAADHGIVTQGAFYDCTYLNHLASKAGLAGDAWLKHCEETDDTTARWPLINVHLGVSVENQDAADERIPDLLRTPAAVRLLSCEPLIGEVDLDLPRCDNEHHDEAEWCLADDDATPWCNECDAELSYGHWLNLDGGIDWVIAGCESGPGARKCDVAWLRSLRNQCAEFGVPYFLKQAVAPWPNQLGFDAVCEGAGSKRKSGGVIELPYLDGVQHSAFPKGQQ